MKRVGAGHARNCATDSSSVGRTTIAITVVGGVTGSIPVYPIIFLERGINYGNGCTSD